MPIPQLHLTRPGLFVTATDTGVGKTAVTCAIAQALRSDPGRPCRVGVCKPMASGCRREREGLVSEDTEALAHFSDCRLPLEVITPVRYASPVAPGVAAEASGEPVDFDAVVRSLRRIDEASDVVLVEGVGGLLVPLDADPSGPMLIDLIAALPYPVLVVARATLGTLNHTAMTVSLLRQRGLRLAGVVMNGYEADAAAQASDASIATNRQWLERMNNVPVLAVTPRCPGARMQPGRGVIDPAFLDAVAAVDWWNIVGR